MKAAEANRWAMEKKVGFPGQTGRGGDAEGLGVGPGCGAGRKQQTGSLQPPQWAESAEDGTGYS